MPFRSGILRIKTYYRVDKESNFISAPDPSEYIVEIFGCDQMIILGATGSRIDHIWANVQSLEIARKAGVHAEIRDTCNRIRLCDGEVRLKRREAFGKYFSLFPFGGEVENLTLVGAKYPLDHHHLLPNDSLCVSNEIEEDELVITFSSGTLILMETKDE